MYYKPYLSQRVARLMCCMSGSSSTVSARTLRTLHSVMSLHGVNLVNPEWRYYLIMQCAILYSSGRFINFHVSRQNRIS